MSNRSYCRFRNTLSDLRDCNEALNDGEGLSADEVEAAKSLLALCKRMAERFDESDIIDEQSICDGCGGEIPKGDVEAFRAESGMANAFPACCSDCAEVA